MKAYSGQLIVWVNIEAEDSSEALDKLNEASDELADLLFETSNLDFQSDITADTVVFEEKL